METRYVRLGARARHHRSGRSVGLFRWQWYVHRRRVPAEMKRRMDRHYDWFEERLKFPKLKKRDPRILFWFRADAGEPLRRARQLASWLRSRGILIETVQTTDPGEIVYRDRHQVGAVAGDSTRAEWFHARVITRRR
jgi:hypothetical protein